MSIKGKNGSNRSAILSTLEEESCVSLRWQEIWNECRVCRNAEGLYLKNQVGLVLSNVALLQLLVP